MYTSGSLIAKSAEIPLETICIKFAKGLGLSILALFFRSDWSFVVRKLSSRRKNFEFTQEF